MLQTEADINDSILSVFTRDYCLSYISIYLLRADNSFFVSEKIELFVVDVAAGHFLIMDFISRDWNMDNLFPRAEWTLGVGLGPGDCRPLIGH